MKPVLPLVDSHCHLEEIADLPSVVGRAVGQGVLAIVAVGSDLESSMKTLGIAQKHKSTVFPALGLHPWSLAQGQGEVGQALAFIEEHISQAVAIGEVGLDYHKELVKAAGKQLQQQVLRELLSLAAKYRKPALIHSRYAWRDALELAGQAGVERAVFHWFTGPTAVLREILEAGYYVSATPACAYHGEHRRAVKEAPLERLLLESDAPVVYREGPGAGRPAEPGDVASVLEVVSQLKGVEAEAVAEATTRNAIGLFGLSLSLEQALGSHPSG